MANRLSATITIGGAIAGSLRSALGATRDGFDRIGKSVTDLKSRQKELNRVVADQAKLGQAGSALRVQYAQQELATINKQIAALQKKQRVIDSTTKGMEAGRAKMASAGLAIGAATAAAATAFIPVVKAAQFETAMLGVAKQVEGTRDEAGKLTQVYFDMAKQVQMLGRELPMATSEIAEMVAAGARMGIARDELIGFTRTSAMMANAFDAPAGELAEQMGMLSNLFKLPISRISELGDAINYLDDNSNAKGADIINVLKRIGGTAEFVKMPAREAAALASTFLTLGSSAEVAATAANAVMRELSIASMQPKRFQKGLIAIGMDADKVQQDMSKNATETIQSVLVAINKLPDEKRLTVATQLFGKEYGDDVAKLAGGIETYREQLALAASDKAIGSMAREHEARVSSTAAQWEILKNRMGEVAVNIGSVLLPSINAILLPIGAVASKVADFARENGRLVEAVAVLGGAFAGLVIGANLVKFGIGAATFAFNAFRLMLLTNPVGLAITAFVGLATVAYLVWRNWDAIGPKLGALWESIKGYALAAWESIKGAWLTYTPIGQVVKNWEPIRQFFGSLFDSIRNAATTAMDWVLGKITAVGDLWGKTKAVFGIGSGKVEIGASATSAPSAAPRPAPQPLPQVPQLATSRGGQAASVDARQSNVFNITQQPGQDSRKLADDVARRLEERDAVRRRSVLYDPAMGY